MGADPALWRDAKRVPELQYRLDAIREDFAFLFVGHWLPGSIVDDRKDVGRLISLFCQAFAGNSRVALILKTSTGTHSKTDQIEVAKRVASIRSQVADAPSVYLVHGDLTDREMSTLFRHIKVKAFISLTHGEGLMISGLQFSLSGKPLILPGYSGHLDYLFPGHPTMKVEMTPVPPSGLPPGMIGAGAVWGTVPDRTAVEAMRAGSQEEGNLRNPARDMLKRRKRSVQTLRASSAASAASLTSFICSLGDGVHVQATWRHCHESTGHSAAGGGFHRRPAELRSRCLRWHRGRRHDRRGGCPPWFEDSTSQSRQTRRRHGKRRAVRHRRRQARGDRRPVARVLRARRSALQTRPPLAGDCLDARAEGRRSDHAADAVLVYTKRQERIRLISARKATPRERASYEEKS